jgi:hypothetical protein
LTSAKAWDAIANQPTTANTGGNHRAGVCGTSAGGERRAMDFKGLIMANHQNNGKD